MTVLLLSATALVLNAKEPKYLKPLAATPRASHSSLAQSQIQAQRQAQQAGALVPVEAGTLKQPVPESERKGIIERSAILCSGHNWTLVPKGAVLKVPPMYAARVNGKRTGKLVPWPEFYAKNRGWIQTHSVSIKQARGEVEVPKDQVDVYQQSGRVVVSVCHNGPISMIPFRPAESIAAGEAPLPKDGPALR